MTVTGADKFISAMRVKDKEAVAKSKAIVRSVASDLQGQVMRTVPVDTGYLRREVQVQMQGNAYYSQATITANAYNGRFNYGYAQENGTRYIGPKFFMSNAFRIHGALFKQKISEVLKT